MSRLREQSARRRTIWAAPIALVLMASATQSLAAGGGPAGAPAPTDHASAASKKVLPATPVTLVDINSASRAELKTLPGIGAAEADQIIAGRPYLSKADLAVKNVIPTGVYLSLKTRIIAKQKTRPKDKA